MALAVVTVAAGGISVVDVTATTPNLGLPITEAATGIAVTKVTSPRGGLPVTFVAASGGAAWSPLNLGSALKGWYNADPANVSPNTNGATVTVMTDLSGNGNNMAPNGYTGPVYNTTGLSGQPSLDFAGGNATGMRTTADTVALGTGSTASIFMLASFTSGSTAGPYMTGNGQVLQPGASANSWHLVADGSVPSLYSNQNFGSYGAKTAAINTALRLGFIWDGTNGTAYVDNVAGTPAARSFNFTTPGSLGAAYGTFAGKIREIIFTNSALSAGDRASLDAYLVSRMSAPGGGAAPFAMQPLRQGGGGYITGIDIAPDGTRVCRTDTFGAYLWNTSTSKWDQLCTTVRLPAGNQTPLTADGCYEIRIAPSNSNVIYMFYGQGNSSAHPWLFVSTNKGATWVQCTGWTFRAGAPNGAMRGFQYRAAVDPANPACFIACMENGIAYETINGTSGASATFTALSAITTGTTDSIAVVAFDGHSGTTGGRTNAVYVSSYGQGLWVRATPGGSFAQVSGTAGFSIYGLGVEAATGNVFFSTGASVNATTLYRLTWSAGPGSTPTLTNITPTTFSGNIASFLINPNGSGQLTVFAYGGGLGYTNTSSSSTVTSGSWSASNSNYTHTAVDAPYLATGTPGSTANFNNVITMTTADPSNSDILCVGWQGVYKTTYPLAASPSVQAFTTNVLGTEQMASNGIVCTPANSLAVLMQQDWGVMQSQGPNSPPTTQGYDTSTNLSAAWYGDWANDGTFVINGTGPFNLGNANFAKSSNSGAPPWTNVTGDHVSGDGYGSIAVTDATHYVHMGVNFMYRTANGGTTWTTITNPGGVSIASGVGWSVNAFFKRRMIAADRVTIGKFYAFNAVYGTFVSTDNGVNWTQYNNYGGSSSPATADPSGSYGFLRSVIGNAGHLFLSSYTGSGGSYSGPNLTYRFWRSTNGGQTWSIVGPSSTSTDGAIVEVWAHDTGAIATGQSYPAIYIYGWVRLAGVYTQGVFRSIDNGTTWTQLTGAYPDGWTEWNFDLAADKLVYGRFYMAKAGSSFSVGQYA